ncbi:MAG: zinc dependent phospholipase C family protein [Candidatus Tectomicrobia bacterium]|uniref:Zinc dependent phospholipase C family protein n=1 Tax=Tectimicrobiota bacterium TaxID=2528274 RepID=A0A932CLS7_UNCTE|nr:zinc dependent phospholipase C family protein [Candidatus Tectomicrobia bacterium]
MPTTMVHIAFIEELGREDRVEAPLRSLIAGHVSQAKLGAVFPDLQYYENFFRLLARYLLKLPLPFSPWSYLFHSKAPATLGRTFLEVLKKEPVKEGGESKLAFIAGYFSHLALDITLHPPVWSLSQREGRSDLHAKEIHTTCERYQGLLYHQHLYGYDIAGRPLVREKIQLLPVGRRRLDPALYDLFRKACLELFSRAPCPGEFRNWIRGIHLYARILSSPLGKIEGLRGQTDSLRQRYFENEGFSFLEYYRRAKEVAIGYLNAAYRYWQEEEISEGLRRGFLEQVPNVDLGCPWVGDRVPESRVEPSKRSTRGGDLRRMVK